jgi:hypothetical protein
MGILERTRQGVGDTLRRRSIHKHRSRIGWQDASRYTHYLEHAQKAYTQSAPKLKPDTGSALDSFRRDGATSFVTSETTALAQDIFERIQTRKAAGEQIWEADNQERGQHNYIGDLWQDFPELEKLFRGDLGAFLQNNFKAHFKILHGVLYHSIGRDDARVGSQRWHSDSGPGICVNVMFYLHETGPQNGTLEALPWDAALDIYDREPTEIRRRLAETGTTDRRLAMADYYDAEITGPYADRIIDAAGSAGLVIPFLNNTLHRGGYPAPGHERTAIVFHCYPSHLPTDFERYARNGIGKTIPYPKNPADEF